MERAGMADEGGFRSGPSSGPRLALRPAWRRDDPQLQQDAIAFWAKWDLLPAGVWPAHRASELCVVAYAGDEVAAVSTAELAPIQQVRARFAMFRCAVAPPFRKGPVVAELAESSRLALMDWSRAHPQERVKGMATVTETPGLVKMKQTAVWRYKDLRLVLIGFTNEGHPIRVAWFPGARLNRAKGWP
jgi:hypothetical protein